MFDQHSLPLSVHIFQRSLEGFVLTVAELRTIIVLLRMSTFGVHEQFFYYTVSCFVFFSSVPPEHALPLWAGVLSLQVGLKNTHPLVEGFSFLFIDH